MASLVPLVSENATLIAGPLISPGPLPMLCTGVTDTIFAVTPSPNGAAVLIGTGLCVWSTLGVPGTVTEGVAEAEVVTFGVDDPEAAGVDGVAVGPGVADVAGAVTLADGAADVPAVGAEVPPVASLAITTT